MWRSFTPRVFEPIQFGAGLKQKDCFPDPCDWSLFFQFLPNVGLPPLIVPLVQLESTGRWSREVSISFGGNQAVNSNLAIGAIYLCGRQLLPDPRVSPLPRWIAFYLFSAGVLVVLCLVPPL